MSKIYQLYILAGQSNMEGMGFVRDLPESLKKEQKEVWIYNAESRDDHLPVANSGHWEELRPGCGYGYRSDGIQSTHSDRFGIELTFAKRLKELRPEQNFALFKYTKGGSSIHPEAPVDWGCWDPDYKGRNAVNQWTHFEHHYRRALANFDINSDRTQALLVPAAILWLQGETDASFSRKIASAYPEMLCRLMKRMRRLAGNPELPVAIGRISESRLNNNGPVLPWAQIVQQAQSEFVSDDNQAALVLPPETIGWLDPWHYDSRTYLEFGVRFAEAVNALLPKKEM